MTNEQSLEAWQLNRKSYWNQREKRGWLLAVAPTDWMNDLESYLINNGCSREQAKELVINVFSVIQNNFMEQVILAVVQRWLHGLLDRITQDVTPRHIVDVGVGTGEFAVRIAGLISQRGYKYTGVDFAESMLAHVNNRLAQAGLVSGAIKITEGLATNLPLENESVWLLTWGKFGEHLTDDSVWAKGLDEVKRVLEHGGFFLLYEPVRDFNERYKEQPRKSEGTLFRWQHEYDAALAPLVRVESHPHKFCNEVYIIALWQKS
jgi:ubiquinone/menaquinone biosynthesis C-methylase UbiE